jgi:hypothetical protein
MITPMILIDDDLEGQYTTPFPFVFSDCNGIFISKNIDYMAVLINGTEYYIEYNKELYNILLHQINVKNLMNMQ